MRVILRFPSFLICFLLPLTGVANESLIEPAAEQAQSVFDLSLEQLLKIKVSTASRLDESATIAPADIRVITQAQIQRRGYRHLEDLLSDIVSVDLQRASSATSYNNLTFRGITGNSKFIILLDGIRISSPTGEDIPVSSNFPLTFVRQVEIVLGPGSALYGADAVSAVINLISRDDFGDNNAKIQAELGDDGYQRWLFSGAWQIGSRNQLALSWEDSVQDGRELADEYPQVYELDDLIDFGGNLVVPAANRGDVEFPLSADHGYVRWVYDKQITLTATRSIFSHPTSTGTKPSTVNYDRNPRWVTYLQQFNLQWQPVSQQLIQSYQINYSSYEIKPESKFSNIFVGFADGFKYSKGTRKRVSADLQYHIDSDTHLAFGAAWEAFESIPKTADLPSRYNTDLSYDQQGLNYLFVGDLPVQIFKISWHNRSAYIQLKNQFTEKLSLTSGIRLDKSTLFGQTANPRVGMVYQAAENQVWKFLYGEAFLAPNPRFTHDHFGSFAFQRQDGLYQSFFMQIPNEKLKPETLKNQEISYQLSPADNLNIKLSVFHNNLTHFIDRRITETPVSDFINGGFITTTQIFDNIGEVDVYGQEFDMQWHENWAGGELDLNFGLAHHQGDFIKDATNNGVKGDLPLTAKWKSRIRLSWSSQHWSHSLGYVWNSKVANSANEFVAGQKLLNWYSNWKADDKPLGFQLRISNVLDEQSSVAGEASSSVLTQIPQERRRINIGVTLQW